LLAKNYIPAEYTTPARRKLLLPSLQKQGSSLANQNIRFDIIFFDHHLAADIGSAARIITTNVINISFRCSERAKSSE